MHFSSGKFAKPLCTYCILKNAALQHYFMKSIIDYYPIVARLNGLSV